MYSKRYGNNALGDGWKYRARGLIGITFLDNYRDCGNGLKVDLVAQPELLAQDEYAARSAAWFFATKGCMKYTGDPCASRRSSTVARTVSTTGGRVTMLPVRRCYDLGICQSILETVAYRGDACCAGCHCGGCWNVHGSRQYDAGYAQAQADQKQSDDKASHNVIRRKHKLNVKHNLVSMWRVLMLSMLIPLLTACAPNLTKPSDSPNTIPDLSPLARQPARSSVCSPTCLKKATDLTSQQQKRLSDIGMQDSHASGSTTP